MKNLKPSRFLYDLGFKDTIVKGKKCSCCGKKIDGRNWGGTISKLGESEDKAIVICRNKECLQRSTEI